MRLILDIQGIQSVDHGERGIARYVMEHARALRRMGTGIDGVLLNPALPFPGHAGLDLLGAPELMWNTATNVGRIATDDSVYMLMSPFEFKIAAGTILPAHVAANHLPVVATLYDLIPLLMRETYLPGPLESGRYERRLELLRGAALVLAISECSRRDGIRMLDLDPERVVTIGAGVAPFFHPPDSRAAALSRACDSVPSVRRRFLLCISGADPRKNTERLIAAYARLPAELRSRYQLVLVGAVDKNFRDRWMSSIRAAGLAPSDVVITGKITDEVMRLLYQATDLFVFPALYEGFGLPPAEALACGALVITSNTSSLPEVLDCPDATFDPTSVEEMARLMERSLTDDAFASRIRAVGEARVPEHTWDRVAQRTVDAIENLEPARRHRPRSVARRRRVALVGPMPPTMSGIATYNGRVVPHLLRHCDVDVFFPSGEPIWNGRPAGVAAYPIGALGRFINPQSYDALIYTAGNSLHHQESSEAIKRHPGIVWFHDVRFPVFMPTGTDDYQAVMAGRVQELYGPRGPQVAHGGWGRHLQARFGLGFTRDWVVNARAAIVNSELAERLLILDQGPDAPSPQIWRIPHATEPDPANRACRIDPPVVGTFGIVSPVKAPDMVIEAVSLLRAEGIPAHLAIVGLHDPAYGEELLGQADRMDAERFVTLPGEVDDAEYRAWLGRVTCSVQLRRATNGESSGAISDAQSVGLPVITNMLSANHEFPTGGVVAIDPLADAAVLAAALRPLLCDPVAWKAASDAAWNHGLQENFTTLAGRLAEVIEAVAG